MRFGLRWPGRSYTLITLYSHGRFRGNLALNISLGKWERAYGILKPCKMVDSRAAGYPTVYWPAWLGGMSWKPTRIPGVWRCKHRTNREERERIGRARKRELSLARERNTR